MLFNSYEFVFLFLPISFLIYFYLNKKKLVTSSKIFLVAASLVFYSWWNIVYLPLLLASMLFNFFVGQSLGKNKTKSMLTFGILGNITLLGYFKYTDFFISNFNWAFNKDVNLILHRASFLLRFYLEPRVLFHKQSQKLRCIRRSFPHLMILHISLRTLLKY